MSKFVSGYSNGKSDEAREAEEERKAKDDERRRKDEESRKEQLRLKLQKPATPVPLPAAPAAGVTVLPPGALKRTGELLSVGGFTRMLSWRERRAVRRIERSCGVLRRELLRAFPVSSANTFVRQSCDSLAHIEVASRLELMAENTKETAVKR